MKLYRITLQGMQYSASGPVYGDCFVVAENTEDAYKKVRQQLDNWDVGFSIDRELKTIELIAEEGQYCPIRRILYL